MKLTLGPVGHFLEALGNPGFPQRQPPPERIKSERWCFCGRLGKDSWEEGWGWGQTVVGGGQWAERAGRRGSAWRGPGCGAKGAKAWPSQ